jgi:hypothetical protein
MKADVTLTMDPEDDCETAALLTADPLENLKADFESLKADFESQNAVIKSLLSERRLEEGRNKLPNDTFSFLVCSNILSQPFLLGISVFVFQITIYSLLTKQLINRSSENPLGIPENVETIVRVTQFLAIFIAVLTQEDLRTSLEQVNEGYSTERIGKEFGEATRGKWWFATACRFLQGALGLIVTFFLIVTVDNIFELLLNFTAMEFVSNLDDVAFFSAGTGYFGSKSADKSEEIDKTTYPQAADEMKRRKTLHVILLAAVFIGMLAAWGGIVNQQRSDKYLCNEFFVYSSQTQLVEMGFYELVSPERNDDRVQYIHQNGTKEPESGLRFGYCGTETAWAYYSNGDGCTDFTARSAETTTFDIRTTLSSPWVSDNQVQLDPIRFLCVDGTRDDGQAVTRDRSSLPSELGNLSGLSECINCESRLCGSASSSTNNFAAFRCLSFVCLSIHILLLCSVIGFEVELIDRKPA